MERWSHRWAAAAALVALSCTAGSRPVDSGVGFDAPVASEGGGPECLADYECDDRVACTIDRCGDGTCENRPCTDCCPEELTCLPGFGCRTPPRSCTDDEDCRDEVRCTLDFCRDDMTCAHDPQPDLCGDGEICLPAVGCIPEPPTTCTSASDCEGASFCVGEWSCEPEFGCQFVSLRSCDDGDPCTVDACDEEADACTHVLVDGDGDGHVATDCGGDDCDDTDAAINPSASEVCGGGDEDCDGEVDDGCCTEGLSCTASCGSSGTTSCDEGMSSCTPPAESCNGADDDCDGTVDDGFACVPGTTGSCSTGCGSTGTRECLGDCTFDSCVPPAEVCNGVDDDCDGACDDGFACCEGSTRDCTALGFFTGTAVCQAGCGGYDTSGCTNCGDGSVDAGEECDGTDLGGASCTTIGMGFGSGTLACGAGCRYDTTGCSLCGNGSVDAGEECDGADLGGADCTSIPGGFTGGTLECAPSCTYDTAMCTMFDPTGTYSVTPAPTYSCAYGLVSFSGSTMSFSLAGTTMTLTMSGIPCSPTGIYDPGARSFDLTCTEPGTCAETYRLTGAFTGDDTWSATFSASFAGGGGACFDCANRSWSVTGDRS